MILSRCRICNPVKVGNYAYLFLICKTRYEVMIIVKKHYRVGDVLINQKNEECEVIAVLKHFIRIRNKVTGVKECYQIFNPENRKAGVNL